jgi:hypothetical protein
MAPAAYSQTVTGSVSGTVVDSGGAVVVGASVTLTNDISKQAVVSSLLCKHRFSGCLVLARYPEYFPV